MAHWWFVCSRVVETTHSSFLSGCEQMPRSTVVSPHLLLSVVVQCVYAPWAAVGQKRPSVGPDWRRLCGSALVPAPSFTLLTTASSPALQWPEAVRRKPGKKRCWSLQQQTADRQLKAEQNGLQTDLAGKNRWMEGGQWNLTRRSETVFTQRSGTIKIFLSRALTSCSVCSYAFPTAPNTLSELNTPS